ncbi:MAG TPA: LysR substrate-binding domain-containing protein [Burkholderiaceae bacterium]|nr:LysR substrate-binding domain-containing protein [Burkholderiaceae bacterium]
MPRRPTRPIQLATLRGFDAAARHLSFTRAADELHLTQSSVSRQIQTLEDEVGKPLFARKTRALELTAAGQRLHRAVRGALHEIDRAVTEVRSATSRKRVSLTTWPSFASLWLVPRLADFARLHPEIDIRIDASDRVLDLQDDDLDIALRYCRDEQAPRDAIRLLDEELTPALAPALLERMGPLNTPKDLARYPLIVLDDRLPSSDENSWERWFALAGAGAPPPSRLVFTYIDQTMQAAARGQGVVLAKTQFLRDFEERGELVAPFAQRLASRYRCYLLLNAQTRDLPHVSAFVDWLTQQAHR